MQVPSWSSGVTFISEGSYVQQLASAFAGTHLESLCELDIDSPPSSHRMSAIICTIGPACRTVDMLEKMMHAGHYRSISHACLIIVIIIIIISSLEWPKPGAQPRFKSWGLICEGTEACVESETPEASRG